MMMLMFFAGPTLTECVWVLPLCIQVFFVDYFTFTFHFRKNNVSGVHIILKIAVLLKNSTVNKGSRCKKGPPATTTNLLL